MLAIAIESPLSPDGLALIAGSQLALLEVFTPDEIFTLDPAELDVPAISFFVARADGRAVGCVALLDCGDYGEIKRLYVGPEGRGKGLARALMAALETHACLRGQRMMRLETGDALVAAVALYKSLGYAVRGPFGDYPEHPASLFMERTLPGGAGHCLCGQVRFAYAGAPEWVAHCHCESCRRNCAAPFTTFLGIKDGAWHWLGAPPTRFASSPGVERLFCPHCGTPMAYRAERWPQEQHFYAATLEDPASVTPQQHVNYAEHLAWIALADGLPRR